MPFAMSRISSHNAFIHTTPTLCHLLWLFVSPLQRGSTCAAHPPPPVGRAERAGYLFFLLPSVPASKACFKCKAQNACPKCLPPSFYSFPRTHTDRPAGSKVRGNLLLRPQNAIFLPSKNLLVFCFLFFSKKHRKSWILASQNLPKTCPKCLQNRGPKKHAIFNEFLAKIAYSVKGPMSLPTQ